MPRVKAILSLHVAEIARRGRAAKGTLAVNVLGNVTKGEDGKTVIDTSPLADVTVAELAEVAKRTGLIPAVAFADGINLHLVRKAYTSTHKPGEIKTTALAEELTKRHLVDNPKDAKAAAREVKRLAHKMNLNPEEVLKAIAMTHKGGGE